LEQTSGTAAAKKGQAMSADGDSIRPWAAGLRTLCLRTLAVLGEGTAADVAHTLGMSVDAIRPRFTELAAQGLVEIVRFERTKGRPATVFRKRETSETEPPALGHVPADQSLL
jgi:predicted ArsR family transcriptional regulator